MKYVRYFMVLRLASAMLVLPMAFFMGCRSTRQPVDLAPIDKDGYQCALVGGSGSDYLNLLERATVLGEEDFTALVNEHKEMNAGLTDNAASELASAPEEMDAAMRLHVRRIFDKYGQNLSKTAEALKVARNTVRRYL